MRFLAPALAALASLAAATPAFADCADDAEDARRSNAPGASSFVDANWGRRNDGAASALNRCHAAYGTRGYEVVDVEVYLENGDFQGFFVTYRRAGSAR